MLIQLIPPRDFPLFIQASLIGTDPAWLEYQLVKIVNHYYVPQGAPTWDRVQSGGVWHGRLVFGRAGGARSEEYRVKLEGGRCKV